MADSESTNIENVGDGTANQIVEHTNDQQIEVFLKREWNKYIKITHLTDLKKACLYSKFPKNSFNKN